MSTKRLLTEKEIENILDFIKPYERIPYETAMSIVYEAKRKLRNQLVNVEIYQEIIPELKKELEKNYNDCKISPGESVGILCAQSIGEKNTQNSVSPIERVVLKHKNNIFQTTIGYFIDKLMFKEDMYEENNYLKKLNGDFEILTISQEENIEWKTISEISKHPTNGDLVKIRTETGREVTTTLSHSHLKRENNKVLPILGSELKIGDRVPVMRKSPMVMLEEKNSEEILMAWFYGVYTSFGSISNKGDFLIIKNTNMKNNELFDFSLRLLLSDLDTKYSIKLENKFFYAIYSSKMVEIIDLHFGNENEVPECVYNWGEKKLKAFLRGFLEENGFISKSNSKLVSVQHLLTRFGIHSRIETLKIDDKLSFYNLYIQNKYYDLFREIFPTVKIDEKLFEKDYETIHPDVKDVENYKSDVVWEKIVDIQIIKECDYNHNYVYDFSVKGNETFGLLNGIVVHNTLNTFHFCGQSERSVVQGVPRFQELLNATKSPKNVNCKIYFNEGNESLKDLRNTVSSNIVCLAMKDVSENIEIRMNKEKEEWYENFKLLYNDKFSSHEHCISIKLDQKKLFKYRIEIKEISDKIESVYDDLYCVFSPQDIGQLDIFIDISRIKFTEKQLLFITEENANEIYIEECVQPILEKLILFGVQGIENIYFSKDDKTDEWYVETDGSNFRKLLGHPIIDYTRLLSNNMWDIYENLGIEATREFLVNEFESIMEGINLCHVKLLVERMTFSGNINSISRYTLRKDDAGVLSKASFEESTDNFIKAGFSGEIEKTVGVSASIICGKRANIGSGFMDLKMNLNYLDDSIPVFKDENNDGVVIENKGGYSKFKMYTNLETDT